MSVDLVKPKDKSLKEKTYEKYIFLIIFELQFGLYQLIIKIKHRNSILIFFFLFFNLMHILINLLQEFTILIKIIKQFLFIFLFLLLFFINNSLGNLRCIKININWFSLLRTLSLFQQLCLKLPKMNL